VITAGVDLGGRKAAISIYQDGVLTNVASAELARSTRSRELRTLADWCFCYLRLADLVVVEEPLIGRGTQASLQVAHTFGAVLATLGDTHTHTSVYTVPVATWKKEVVGKGNANKEAVRMWLEETYPAYAVKCGGNQDRIDAACIGLYGVQLGHRATQLAEL